MVAGRQAVEPAWGWNEELSQLTHCMSEGVGGGKISEGRKKREMDTGPRALVEKEPAVQL
jgi:hypothetical protein